MIKVLNAVTATLTTVAFVVLLLVMAITFIDVVGRYFFNTPLTFSVELVRMGMGLIVLCGLPISTLRRSHVSVDLVEYAFSARGRRVLGILASLCSFVVLVLFAWRLWVRGVGFREDGIATDILFLPIWPVVIVMAVAVAFAAVVAAVQIFRPGLGAANPTTTTDTIG